ncbi:tRNA (guanine46-N7)-methyltransferase [Aspergillus melleus]|uniref:tRNA (guanine46-N7)-methyltransferase n=1 Tax=Aspergillus melleus TaxID=138277 RepID=UPI001E8EAC8C|nr:tRNA (guanine-N(7)-)-methyltransferase (tRNA(m7G46)-methyltransferase) [Aspergillus melleus]KAH8422663.1 tRNA (guanine-N(7)-)-methyltransferase (tRNA(m7G46)-methyltransferase) [Aspergillus melleus]
MSTPPAKRQKCELSQRGGQKRQGRDQYRNASAEDAAAATKLPQKKFFRQRAHANPFSDHQLKYPLSPAHMDWSTHFPAFVNPDPMQTNLSGARKLVKDVEVVDIGCGFGGLLVGLAPVLPDTLMVGMEIRTQVLEYVTNRVNALRSQQLQLQQRSASNNATPTPTPTADQSTATPTEPTTDDAPTDPSTPTVTTETERAGPVAGGYQNISALRSNTMKFFPNFFGRHQLSKIFICFPDPHFKARKHKARIISETLNAEYAYALRPGGLLYTITDVEEYHHWVLRHFRDEEVVDEDEQEGGVKELFERVSEEELQNDPCVRVMSEETEESKKVTRNKGNKYVAVFRRKEDPEWPA